jgi:hypothetical protein
VSAYDLLRQAGYTNLVVYLTQQIQQFHMRGEEFAMQHLGTEDELKQVLREIVATMSREERLHLLSEDEWKQSLPEIVATLSLRERLEERSADVLKPVLRKIVTTMPPEERLEGLSAEERLKGLTPEQLEQLRQLLEQRRPADGNHASPKRS